MILHYDYSRRKFEIISPDLQAKLPAHSKEVHRSEKGKRGRGEDNWDNKTLFNLIDSKGQGTDLEDIFDETNYIVCDDMRTEIADFIRVEPNKLIFIHVKGIGNNPNSTGSKVSASAISEVCNQAIKNIHYISRLDLSAPPNINSWSDPYINKNGRTDVDITIKNRRRGDAIQFS